MVARCHRKTEIRGFPAARTEFQNEWDGPWSDIAGFLFDTSVQQCEITVDYLKKAGYEVVCKIRGGSNARANMAMTTNPAVRRLINKFRDKGDDGRIPTVPEWNYRIYFRKLSGRLVLSHEHISVIEDGKCLADVDQHAIREEMKFYKREFPLDVPMHVCPHCGGTQDE